MFGTIKNTGALAFLVLLITLREDWLLFILLIFCKSLCNSLMYVPVILFKKLDANQLHMLWLLPPDIKNSDDPHS